MGTETSLRSIMRASGMGWALESESFLGTVGSCTLNYLYIPVCNEGGWEVGGGWSLEISRAQPPPTCPVHNVFDACKYITRASRRGLGPGN
jgi:hypothetical protein